MSCRSCTVKGVLEAFALAETGGHWNLPLTAGILAAWAIIGLVVLARDQLERSMSTPRRPPALQITTHCDGS